MALLEVKNLGISFGGLRAVNGFDISIEKEALYGLIGPNGAGKTTVFNMLTGVYRPTDGGIRLDGQNLIGKKPHDICKMGVARTFQNIRLFKSETVYNNVLTACHAELDHPPLQNTKGNQHKGDERCCLDKVHRNFAGRGKLAAFN